MTRTKIIPTNGKNLDDGYVIENPYATKQKIYTDLVEAGFTYFKLFICRRKTT